jgi:hypothetical protein
MLAPSELLCMMTGIFPGLMEIAKFHKLEFWLQSTSPVHSCCVTPWSSSSSLNLPSVCLISILLSSWLYLAKSCWFLSPRFSECFSNHHRWWWILFLQFLQHVFLQPQSLSIYNIPTLRVALCMPSLPTWGKNPLLLISPSGLSNHALIKWFLVESFPI